MAQNIDSLPHHSGRYLGEDSTTLNIADWLRGTLRDSATDSLLAIDYDHHKIHFGDSYTCHYEQEVSDTGDKTIITFRTPDTTKWIHVIALASASFPATFSIIENVTITDNTGATLAIFNRDRNSGNTSGVWDTSQNPDVQGDATFFTEVTMGNVTVGTEIEHAHMASGAGPRAIGGENRGLSELILKQNQEYAFVVESLTNDTNSHAIILNWYEHTNL